MTTRQLSEQAMSVWAKTGGPTEWLPLDQHLLDSVWIAAYLYDSWISHTVRERWNSTGLSDGQFRSMVLFLAGVHDVGKAAPAFVAQSEPLAQKARDAGLACRLMSEIRDDRRELPHSLISEYSLRQWLMLEGLDKEVAEPLASVVGAHHGTPMAEGRMRNPRIRKQGMGGDPWRAVRNELIDWISELTGFSEVLVSGDLPRIPLPILVEATGLVIVADWLASNTRLFPLRGRDEDGAPTLDMGARALHGWEEAAMPPPWEPAPVDTSDLEAFFRARFALPDDAVPHAVQQTAVELASTVDVGLMFIETSTGGGKTEAALAVAEVVGAQRGAQGILIALPTQATTDAMFTRIADWLERLPELPKESAAWAVTLGHGKASLNRRYAKMSEAVRNFDHVFNTARSSGIHEDETDGMLCNAVVHQWFLSSKRRLLANFSVVTIDQLLMAGLQRKHLMLAHVALSGKIVIIDEAHSSDEFMSVYLESVLSWLGAYDVSIIVLSATLTAERKRAMMKAYAGARSAEIDALPMCEDDYPLISVVPRDDQPVRLEVVDERGQERSVTWSWHGTSVEEIVASVRADADAGACVLVVRNTVKDAQATADALTEAGLPVTLNHAGFIAVDRANNDLDLIHRFGKGSDEETRPGQVVVATQVVEQSLDIDFDALYTDIAPADLLLQRIGRLHRHSWRARPESHREARTFFLTDVGSGPIPAPTKGSEIVYGGYLLLRTTEALTKHGAVITLPQDTAPLVASALGPEAELLSDWAGPVNTARGKYLAQIAKARAKAAQWCVRPWAGAEDDRATLGEWLATSGDFTELAMGAAVRDTEPSLEVILVPTLPDGSSAIRPPWLKTGTSILDVSSLPSDDLAREVASWSVRLPGRLTRWDGALDAVIQEIDRDPRTRRWLLRRHPLLRSELLLVMAQTHEGSNTLSTTLTVGTRSYELRYSPEQGMEVNDS